MARVCPSCRAPIPLLRGVDARPPDPAEAGSGRSARRRLYCRSCGARIRAALTVVGRAVLLLWVVAMIANLVAFVTGLLDLSGLMTMDVLIFGVLSACDIQWGRRFELVSER